MDEEHEVRGGSTRMVPPNTVRVAILSGLVLVALVLGGGYLLGRPADAQGRVGMAVEFMDHAAAAYVAQDKGWYRAQGLRFSSYKTYVTGMALASALARGDIQVAYMCLAPAINAYANAGVPIKIVAGTHKYGYALVADSGVVTGVDDLAKDNVRIGCVRQGGSADLVLNRTIDKFGWDRASVLRRVRRMNPPRLLVALQTKQLDAAFLPEQWASMAEDLGHRVLLTARDVWPGMQGSVLVATEEVIRDNPGLIQKLVAVNEDATRWINQHPEETAGILSEVLSVDGEHDVPGDVAALAGRLRMHPGMMLRSMRRLEYTTSISLRDVQEAIEYASGLGYIKEPFPAGEIVHPEFMR